jgi:hypothetical protein
MATLVLDTIPFKVDIAELRRRLGMPEGPSTSKPAGVDHDSARALEELAGSAEKVARPKAAFKIGFIDERSAGEVVIDGIRFASRVLRVNLDPIHRVFPHVATCGKELEEWSEGIADPVDRFAADLIKELAVRDALEYLRAHICAKHAITKLSHMNPGSLPDWPLPQQAPLFELLGDLESLIGVRLTESFLMLPTKTVSGIFFPTEATFESCQLCPREVCPSRRAPYEQALYESRYAVKGANG